MKRIVAFLSVYETVPHRRHYPSTHTLSDLAFPFFFFLLGVVLDDRGIHQDVKKEGAISLYGATCRMELLRCQE